MKRGHTEESDSSEKKVRTDDQQLVRPSEVPEYLFDSEFYRSLDTEDDKAFHIPAGHIKGNRLVKTCENACALLNTARFWGLKESVIHASIIQFASVQGWENVSAALREFENDFPFLKGLPFVLDNKHALERRMEAAMELGVIELVNWLDRQGGVVYTEKAIALAASLGHADCLLHGLQKLRLQLIEKSKPWSLFGISDSMCMGAVINGQLECVKLLFQSNIPLHKALYHSGTELTHAAALNGQFECVQYLHEISYPLENCAAAAATSGSLDCLKYIMENRPTNIFRDDNNFGAHVCVAAAKHGHLHCLQYVHEQNCPWDYNVNITAALHGHLSSLQYAHERGCPWSEEVCVAAAQGGHLQCLKYAREHGCPWSSQVRVVAAQHEHQPILEYAEENNCPTVEGLPTTKTLRNRV